MWKQDFVAAKRILLRHKGFSLINILGLAFGMGACLLMLMYVVNESLYEDFHSRADRICRVALEWGQKGSRMKFAGTMPALGPALATSLPEVESAVRVQSLGEVELRLKSGDRPVPAVSAVYADAGFFSMFSYPWLHGDLRTALSEPNSAVVSLTLARALFGAEPGPELLGRAILLGDKPVTVRGIMADSPPNTHLRPDLVLSYATFEAAEGGQSSVWTSWGMDRTYVLFRGGVDASAFRSKVQTVLENNVSRSLAEMMVIHIQPLKKIHWITDFRGDLDTKGNRAYFIFFISAAALILAVACFNFINLSSAQNLERTREIGVRLVLGATRGALVRQLLRESLVVASIAAFIGGAGLESAWRPMMAFIGAPVVLTSGHLPTALVILFAVFLAALAAGVVPAWTVSGHKPVEILGRGTSRPRPVLAIRKFLFTAQFVITIALMIAAIVIFRQLDFAMNSDLGFVKERALLVPYLHAKARMAERYEVVRQELEKIPGVTAVSAAETAPGIRSMSNMLVFSGTTDPASGITMQGLKADYGFAEALGLRVLSGRWFSRDFGNDRLASVLVNETAARILGLKSPIGASLKIPRGEELADVTVIGIVKDFHVQSLHHKINPMVISLGPDAGVALVIRARSGDLASVSDSVRRTLERIIPEARFDVRSLDREYAKGYVSEEKTAQILGGFALLAVVISCAGLLGLTSYMIARRVKEIGIRKVLGASGLQIVSLFSREYLVMVLAANLVAWPLGYFAMERWLRNFAYRISVGIAAFALAAAAALLLALLTVGVQAARAAQADPVESLRYE